MIVIGSKLEDTRRDGIKTGSVATRMADRQEPRIQTPTFKGGCVFVLCTGRFDAFFVVFSFGLGF